MIPTNDSNPPKRKPSVPASANGRTTGAGPFRIWGFGLKFALLIGTYYCLILFPFFDRLMYSYLRANAWASNGLLHLVGLSTTVSEVTLRTADFAISVRRGCDAIEPTWFFCAAVIAFPLPFRTKWIGLVLGSLIILATNLLRIASLFYVGLRQPDWFNTLHVEIWPVVFILLAMGLCLGWIRWAQSNASSTSHASQS